MRVQNQTGNHPTKWDRTGTIVEVRQFHQYLVRMDGSGRLSLRNRKFLRKYVPSIGHPQDVPYLRPWPSHLDTPPPHPT